MTSLATIPETSIDKVHFNEQIISQSQKKSDRKEKCSRHVIGKVKISKSLKPMRTARKLASFWEN